MKTKRILLFVIPCIIIIAVGIILGAIEKEKPKETGETHIVTFYLTLKDYCNCVDCGCITGPRVYKEVEVKDGEKVTKPEDPTEAVRKFAGWTLTDGGTELFDFDTKITKDIKLYSLWNEN